METTDIVIVGSGFGGSIPALRLALAGHEIVVLEQGERLQERDFKQDWSFLAQSRLFVNYTSKDYQTFFRYGRGLGGGSLTFAGAMLRAPSEVFAYADAGGHPVWPKGVTRSVMDPHYQTVEAMMSVTRAGWHEVPKAGAAFALLLDKMGLTCDRANYPYVDCLQCGFCMCGCPFGRKKHLGTNYIPQAESAGAEFRTGCKVHHLEKEGSGYSTHYRDAHGVWRTIASDRVLLAAGALETPCILLRSKPYLQDLHPQVGKNLNNNGDVALMFVLPEDAPSAYAYMGRNNAGMITYAFWAEHRVTIHAGGGPPAIVAALDVVRDDGGKPDLPYGLELKHFMKSHYPHRVISALAIGLVDGVGEVSVDQDGLCEFDLPRNPILTAYLERVAGIGRQIASGTGAKLLRTAGDTFQHGDAHPLGTCRMGDDAERAPCTPEGELRSHPGIYCTDGSSIPGGTGVNPALTIGANAERIAAALVSKG